MRRVVDSEQYSHWFSDPALPPGTVPTSPGPSNPLPRPDLLRKRAFSDFGATIERFLEDLAFLAHVTGGQASRGTELLSLRFRNTQGGGLRNVFLDRGLIMLITGYHKGYNQSGITRVIHRFLPKPVGELLVYYL